VSSKEIGKSERPLSVELSVKWRVELLLARTSQNSAKTRPLLANASEPDRFTIHDEGGKVGAGNLAIQDGLPERFVLGVEQDVGFRFVLGAQAELLAGGGVFVVENTGLPE
jgi:hypothetical protein